MTRIQPECFIEVWIGSTDTIIYESIKKIKVKKLAVGATSYAGGKTIALFLIKPQSTTLSERLEARKVNNNLKLAI